MIIDAAIFRSKWKPRSRCLEAVIPLEVTLAAFNTLAFSCSPSEGQDHPLVEAIESVDDSLHIY